MIAQTMIHFDKVVALVQILRQTDLITVVSDEKIHRDHLFTSVQDHVRLDIDVIPTADNSTSHDRENRKRLIECRCLRVSLDQHALLLCRTRSQTSIGNRFYIPLVVV